MLKNKKILFLVKTMDLGGAERFTVELSNAVKNDFESVTVASSGGPYEELLKKNGIKHITLKQGLRISNIFNVTKELRTIQKNDNYDIIHTQHRILQFALQLLPRKNFKNVYTSHNYFTDIYQKLIFTDKAAAVSPSIEQNLKRTSFIKKEKITFIPCGTEVMPDVPYKLHSPITFGFSGRLIEEKGIYLLLFAAAALKTQNFLFKVVYRGSGNTEELQYLIKEFGLEDKITILPFTNDREEIYNDFDVLVLPSVFNEGLPLSILEAASRKKLIITGKAGGSEDFVKHEMTGLVIKNLSPITLAEEMEYVIEKQVNYEKLTSDAYYKLKEEYSVERAREKYLELYCSLFE